MGRSHDLARGASSLYQTQTASDTRYVNTTGDTMSGTLNVNGGNIYLAPDDAAAHRYMFLNTGASQDGHIVLQRGLANKYQVTALQDNSYSIYSYPAGGEVFNIDGSGRVTKPNQPHLLAMGYKERYGTTDRHLFKTITTNTGNHWNNVNGKFTCPVDGDYLVTAFSGYKESTTHAGIGIGYNGSVLSYGWSLSSDRHTQQSCTTIKSASANDYFYYYAHTSYTTPINSTGNEHHSHFSIYLLG